MDIGQTQFLLKAEQQAEQSGHIWPKMAACEAALESGWGKSALAIQANNLFGMKVHTHQLGNVINMPTKEYLGDQWTAVKGQWCKYSDWSECFEDRMLTLRRLSPTYLHYLAALQAANALDYVRQVSYSWSTDPNRAAKVIAIYEEPR